MENILYLDDYINFYNKKIDKIMVIQPYKNTLKNGKIIDRDKFIKKFNKFISDNNLKNNIFNNNISIITNNGTTEEDKKTFLEVFDELNYKNITFISEIDYLKIDKNSIYINYNYSYFYIYNINESGKVEISFFDLNKLGRNLMSYILNYFNKKKIFIFGKNYQELDKEIKNKKIQYYYFEESDNLILKKLLSK